MQEQHVTVRLASGAEAHVPRRLLVRQEDDTYHLQGAFEDFTEGALPQNTSDDVVEEARVPLVEETAHVRKVKKETGHVRIRTHVRTRTERIEASLERHEVDIERVPVDAVIDAPASIRHEGNTTIIPVMEERLVVTKQLVLTEEVHVRPRRSTRPTVQDVTLRSEEADIQRTAPEVPAPDPDAPPA